MRTETDNTDHAHPLSLPVGMTCEDIYSATLADKRIVHITPSDADGFWYVQLFDVSAQTEDYTKRAVNRDGIIGTLCGWKVCLPAEWTSRPCSRRLPGDWHAQRMHPPTRSERGCVYFIQARVGGPIKIGYASFAEDRLAQLERMSPVPLRLLAHIPGTKATEGTLHKRFRRWRHHGEWFEPAPELCAFIKEIRV